MNEFLNNISAHISNLIQETLANTLKRNIQTHIIPSEFQKRWCDISIKCIIVIVIDIIHIHTSRFKNSRDRPIKLFTYFFVSFSIVEREFKSKNYSIMQNEIQVTTFINILISYVLLFHNDSRDVRKYSDKTMTLKILCIVRRLMVVFIQANTTNYNSSLFSGIWMKATIIKFLLSTLNIIGLQSIQLKTSNIRALIIVT